MSLPFCPKFAFGDDQSLILSLPITAWTRQITAVGGDAESGAGVRASYIVRRSELLTFSLRFREEEWPDVAAWLAVVQLGEPFLWYPDALLDDAFTVVLEQPAIGTTFAPTPDATYPRVLTLSITLMSGSWAGLSAFHPRTPIPDDGENEEPPPEDEFEEMTFEEGTSTVHITGSVTVLLVGGGGSSSNLNGGGGGGVRLVELTDVDEVYTVVVGGSDEDSSLDIDETNVAKAKAGQNSISVAGGLSGLPTQHNGASGPSGVGQGANGASGGGGGGGAGGAGSGVTTITDTFFAQAGDGGTGLTITFHGAVIGTFGGGGGGGATTRGSGAALAGSGGSGGGGNGGSNGLGSPGADGLGGGAGGGDGNDGAQQFGGSGIAKILYAATEATVILI